MKIKNEQQKQEHEIAVDKRRWEETKSEEVMALNKEKAAMEDVKIQQMNLIKLNVGGREIATSKSNLLAYPDCMLAKMFSGKWKLETDEKGSYFIDR